jgi:toxin ParE1/3/4
MSNIQYSPMALDDLKQISDYISDHWGEDVAKKVLKKITSDIRRLEQYPASGVDLGKIIDVPTDYRYLYSEKNYVFYRLELNMVKIVRVLNEHQDYVQLLLGNRSDS